MTMREDAVRMVQTVYECRRTGEFAKLDGLLAKRVKLTVTGRLPHLEGGRTIEGLTEIRSFLQYIDLASAMEPIPPAIISFDSGSGSVFEWHCKIWHHVERCWTQFKVISVVRFARGRISEIIENYVDTGIEIEGGAGQTPPGFNEEISTEHGYQAKVTVRTKAGSVFMARLLRRT